MGRLHFGGKVGEEQFPLKKYLLSVAAGSAALFLAISYPLMFRFFSSVFADPQWPFDTYGTLYGIWWMKYAFQHGIAAGVNPLLAHPFGLDWSHLPTQPLFTWPLFLLSLVGGEIFAYNFFVVLSYALTGAFAFALCYYLTGHPRGSLLGALIYTFSANHLLQTMSHLSFSAIQWIPLFVLSCFYLWEKRSMRAAIFCAISFCFLFWSNYYFFYFSILFVLFFLFGTFFYRREFPLKGMGKLLAMVGLISGLLLLPQLIPLAKKALAPKASPEVAAAGYVRSLQDLAKYAGRLSDYFLPSEYHPISGRVTRWYQSKVTGKGRHWSDRTLYAGTFSLFMAPSLFFFRRRFTPRDRSCIWVAFAGILFFAWISLAPWVRVGPLSIPTPSAILYPLFPMFRYYSRAGFFVSLFFSILVAYVWKYHSIQFSSARAKNIVCALAAFAILFEFAVVPPARNLDLSPVPPVYQWLKEQPGDFAIVEYPFVRAIEERQQKYMFYQRIHGKKFVNGGDEGTLSDALRKHCQHLKDPAVWSLLAYLETRYLIVHENHDKFEGNHSLKLVGEFGSSKVYSIIEPPQLLYAVLWNFGQAETHPDGQTWRWIGRSAKIWCLSAQTQPAKATLKMTLFSPEANGLKVILNEREVFHVKVQAGEAAAATIQIPDLELKPQQNIIQFIPDKMRAHPQDPEKSVSFCLAGVAIEIKK